MFGFDLLLKPGSDHSGPGIGGKPARQGSKLYLWRSELCLSARWAVGLFLAGVPTEAGTSYRKGRDFCGAEPAAVPFFRSGKMYCFVR